MIGGDLGEKAARLAFGLSQMVETACSECDAPYFEANVLQVRKFVLGHGRPNPTRPGYNKSPFIDWWFDQGGEVR